MRWTDHLPARCVMAVTPKHTQTAAQEACFVSASQALLSFPDLLGTEKVVCLAWPGPALCFFSPHLSHL